jgi:uncharacterized protein (DUF1015 family)
MQIHPTQIIYPNTQRISSMDAFLDAVKLDFDLFQQQGYFASATKEAIYLIRIETTQQVFNGVACGIAVERYWQGNIKGHEATISAKEEKQMELLQERKAQVKPVMLTYPQVEAIEEWIAQYQTQEEPFLEIERYNNWHIVWQVTKKQDIQQLQQLFLKHVTDLYIADGHHRTHVTARLSAYLEKPLLLYSTLFSSTQIKITAFHRVIDGVQGRNVETFLAAVNQVCEVKTATAWKLTPDKHEIQMYALGKLYQLTWKPEVLASYTTDSAILDAILLDRFIIQEVMQIKDIRETNLVHYVGGGSESIAVIQKLVDKDSDRVGFFLPPIQIEEFITVVQEGVLLPPKSTFFEPRMLNGLLVYEWE